MLAKLALIGGTGPEGRGLALRFALAGHTVYIGSRNSERAQDVGLKIAERAQKDLVKGCSNSEAAQKGDVVFITVPYEGQRGILESLQIHLQGKIVINVVAPLEFVAGTPRAVPVEEGSAAQQCQLLLPDSRTVAAFHSLSARQLLRPSDIVDGDVIVCADDQDAKLTVMALAEKIPGVRGIDGGGLSNSSYVEAFTALLLKINQIYKAHSMFRITGIPTQSNE